MSHSRRIIVIVKQRPFDEARWKRLLIAYAYALYDKQQRMNQAAIAREGGTR